MTQPCGSIRAHVATAQPSEIKEITVDNSTVTNRRNRRPHRVAAALAAGLITVVLGSIDTASAQPSDSPEVRNVRAPDALQVSGGAGGRATYR